MNIRLQNSMNRIVFCIILTTIVCFAAYFLSGVLSQVWDIEQEMKRRANFVKEYITVSDVEMDVESIVSEVYDHYNVNSRWNRDKQENLPTVVEWEHKYMLLKEATRMGVYLDPNKNDDLSEENRIKIDKIKRYIEGHPETRVVTVLYVRLTDVLEKADIPIEQFRAGWHYYHGEEMPPLGYGR